jgi:hypothetical protein
LTTQRGLLGSALLGFPAVLPGKKVSVGAVWSWKGDLLNIHKCDKLLAMFTFKAIVDHKGERCAHITGKVQGWPFKAPPTCTCELFFSLERRMPVTSTLKFTSSSRDQTVQIKVRKPGGKAPVDAKKGEESGTKEGEKK